MINKIIEKHFWKIIICVIIAKIILIFWGSHPFDFWSFVNTIQKSILYNWNLFESWNKGSFLLILWYPLYSLYLILLNILQFQTDNLLLLHFFFKFPFFIMDISIALILFKITKLITKNLKKAKLAFMIWFINPLVYYIYGIHGHYELIVPLALALIFWGIIAKKTWVLSLGLILGIINKYFFIILLPFIGLYFLKERKYKTIFKLSIFTIFGIIISYLHFFTYPELINQTLSSILHLSQANAPTFVQEIRIQPLNIFSAVYSLFHNWGVQITNLNNPSLFSIVNSGFLLSLIGIFFLFILRVYQIFYKKYSYNFNKILKDSIISIILLLVFLTNFQAHYLCWILPLLILVIIIDENILLYTIFTFYTILGFIYSMRGEFGTKTFFLDILQIPNIYSLSSKSSEFAYREAGLITLLLVLVVFVILFIKSNQIKSKLDKINWIYGISMLTLWVIIFLVSAQAAIGYLNEENTQTKLAYNREMNHRGIIYGTYEINNITKEEIIFKTEESKNKIIIPILLNLSEKEKFKAFIIINNESIVSNLENKKIIFNDCGSQNKVESGILPGKFVPSYYIDYDINCLDTINILKIDPASVISKGDLELYITNIKVDYSYLDSKKNTIRLFAIIGALYILISFYFLKIILKSIGVKNDQ
jgi:hypothetical protein